MLLEPPLRSAALTHERLLSVYYDTEDLALWRHGYSLRTRRVGGRWLQILKGSEPPERLTEEEIEGRAVDRTKLPAQGKVGKQLADLLTRQSLRPLFEVELERSQGELHLESATSVAVTLDRGWLRVGEQAEPFQELRLTLQAGLPEDLYGLALVLAERRSPRLEEGGALARGYALLTVLPITHRKAGPTSLPEGASGEEAFSAILGACLEHLRANWAAAHAGQVEGVHQLRVASRRLRSCLKLFRPLIPREASIALVAELRWLNSLLGPVRDWDVFIEEGLTPIAVRLPGKRGLRALQDKARILRQGHYQALAHGLDEPRYHRLILSLYGWLTCQRWQGALSEAQREALARPVVEFATAVLQRHHRRVVKRGKQFAQLSGEQRHALRIRIKQLRYAMEFFASLYRAPVAAAYGRAAAGLQDALGVLNDAVVMERLLDEAGLNRATPTRHLLEGWYAGKLDSYERYFAAQAWKPFMAGKRPWKKAL